VVAVSFIWHDLTWHDLICLELMWHDLIYLTWAGMT